MPDPCSAGVAASCAIGNSDLLGTVVLSGIMGLVGQGIRAAVGLKNAASEQTAPDQQAVFSASYLLLSLMIGFIAGVLAGFAVNPDLSAHLDAKTLLGILAAGYAGTDFIENIFTKFLPGVDQPGPGGKTTNSTQTGGGNNEGQQKDAGAGTLANLRTVELVRSTTQADTAEIGTPGGAVGEAGMLQQITPAIVQKMFPATRIANIAKYLPDVLSGLQSAGLSDKAMVLMALATIRAETEGFVPIPEFKSVFNTDKTPFDKYEPGTEAGNRLGNTQPGDGARFKGRGFVQLTGRDNYTRIGGEVHVDLIGSPDLALDGRIAANILAQFLKDNEQRIREALANQDLKAARQAVNGGNHGIINFTDAYETGIKVIPA